MTTPRVLISRRIFPEARAALGSLDVDYHDSADGLETEALIRRLQGCEGLVCQLTDPVPAALFDACPELRVVANVAVGHDNIDVDAATQAGVIVTNTPGVLTETTADFAFALLLASARRVVEADRFLRDGKWQRWEIDLLCGHDLHRRTLGVVGFGRIGQAVARRARGFDMDVLYHSRSAIDGETESALRARRVELDELLSRSDFVSLHVPLTTATRHLIGAEQLARMKPTAVLVNTARGPIVDEAALARALIDGSIAAAGLDVFEDEPAVHPDLLPLDRAVLVPHLASASVATRQRMCEMACENVHAVLTGSGPLHPVNPEVRPR